MSSFDTVNARCPKCDARIEIQTKVSDCTLRQLNIKAVPPEIAKDLERRSVRCDKCLEIFIIRRDAPYTTVKMSLIRRR